MFLVFCSTMKVKTHWRHSHLSRDCPLILLIYTVLQLIPIVLLKILFLVESRLSRAMLQMIRPGAILAYKISRKPLASASRCLRHWSRVTDWLVISRFPITDELLLNFLILNYD